MTDPPPNESGQDSDPFAIDTSIAYPARVLNYLAGGESNFAADRELAGHFSEALPGGIDTARAAVQALGAFMGRAVRYLAGEGGIRQFLYIGAAIPTAKNVHEVAHQAAPDCRFVYVGDDPVVLAHAHSLRTSPPDGATAYIHGSLSDPEEIVKLAAGTLDLGLPVAVMLPATLVFVAEEDDPYGIVARLMEDVPSGSGLAIAHTSYDIQAAGMAEAAKRLSDAMRDPFVPRSRDEIARFFDGLELVSPGLVQIDEWRPHDNQSVHPTGRRTPIFVAVGRKP